MGTLLGHGLSCLWLELEWWGGQDICNSDGADGGLPWWGTVASLLTSILTQPDGSASEHNPLTAHVHVLHVN
jgi:hypothetical protein